MHTEAVPPSVPDADLLTLLDAAEICCASCGTRYGHYIATSSTWWIATCPICGITAPCTSMRDFAYCCETRSRLRHQLDAQNHPT